MKEEVELLKLLDGEVIDSDFLGLAPRKRVFGVWASLGFLVFSCENKPPGFSEQVEVVFLLRKLSLEKTS